MPACLLSHLGAPNLAPEASTDGISAMTEDLQQSQQQPEVSKLDGPPQAQGMMMSSMMLAAGMQARSDPPTVKLCEVTHSCQEGRR
jgi:hypothetical protein